MDRFATKETKAKAGMMAKRCHLLQRTRTVKVLSQSSSEISMPRCHAPEFEHFMDGHSDGMVLGPFAIANRMVVDLVPD